MSTLFRILVLITTPKLIDMLGLGSIDKCLLSGLLSKELADEMLDKLRHGLQMHAVNSRRICDDEIIGFWGLGIREEKEIVMILTTVEDKINIMQSISDKCGINSEAKEIVLSMPIDSVTGI